MVRMGKISPAVKRWGKRVWKRPYLLASKVLATGLLLGGVVFRYNSLYQIIAWLFSRPDLLWVAVLSGVTAWTSRQAEPAETSAGEEAIEEDPDPQ